MRVAGVYSIKHGQEVIEKQYALLVSEVFEVIRSVKASDHEFNVSKTRKLTEREYNPASIYEAFKRHFDLFRWETLQMPCEYPESNYLKDNVSRATNSIGYRKLDFTKEALGVDVEFGKPLLGVCSICAKMTIFRNFGHIKYGIQIVPVKAFAAQMSSGVSYYEQFLWDLESRGVADIDIPIMILGIDA